MLGFVFSSFSPFHSGRDPRPGDGTAIVMVALTLAPQLSPSGSSLTDLGRGVSSR